MISGQTRLAGVIGEPVRHSLSPLLHNAAFAATGLDWVYLALPVAKGYADAALRAMRTLEISGLNVTMPHKAQVAGAVDRQSASVAKLGACNCVFWDGDTLVGDNTDGDGFVAALRDEGDIDLSGMRLAVLGAGGAARAIIEAAARNGAAQIVVVNRSPGPATEAASLATVAAVGGVEDIVDVDLVVNATSMGMAGNPGMPLDPGFLHSGQIVADIVYEPVSTDLLLAAEAAGARTIGGLGMLIRQAAASFEHFTGVAAPLEAMQVAARQQLSRSS